MALPQSSVQDRGEEVEEGAIYNVTLKRCQIQQAANKGARWLGVSGPLLFHYNTLVESTQTCERLYQAQTITLINALYL